jgi:hypothetical protein
MATSGEAVVRYTVDTYCTQGVNLFGFEDLTCNWEGAVDVYVDSDDSAVFTCGDGHVNRTTWRELT